MSTVIQESDTKSSLVTNPDHFPEVAANEAPRSPACRPTPYTSLSDFVERTRTSVEITDNLVRVGAFDTLGTRREELLAQLPILYAGISRRTSAGGAAQADRRPVRPSAARRAARRADGQSDEAEGGAGEALRLVADELPSLAFLPSWSLEDRVRAELNILGLNVSAHPLAFLREQTRALRVTPCAELPNVPHGRRVRLAGVLERAQMPWIRSGHRTLFLTLEDETELCQVVVFNDAYLKYGRILKDALYFYVEGVLQNDEEHGLAVVAQRIFNLLEVVKERTRPAARRRHGRRGARQEVGRSPPQARRPGACLQPDATRERAREPLSVHRARSRRHPGRQPAAPPRPAGDPAAHAAGPHRLSAHAQPVTPEGRSVGHASAPQARRSCPPPQSQRKSQLVRPRPPTATAARMPSSVTLMPSPFQASCSANAPW